MLPLTTETLSSSLMIAVQIAVLVHCASTSECTITTHRLPVTLPFDRTEAAKFFTKPSSIIATSDQTKYCSVALGYRFIVLRANSERKLLLV